jgi:hypothetical protein
MSTNANCRFYEIKPGVWYYVLEDSNAPSNSWDWREYSSAYGPFNNKHEAQTHLSAYHANPGGWTTIPFDKNHKSDVLEDKLISEAQLLGWRSQDYHNKMRNLANHTLSKVTAVLNSPSFKDQGWSAELGTYDHIPGVIVTAPSKYSYNAKEPLKVFINKVDDRYEERYQLSDLGKIESTLKSSDQQFYQTRKMNFSPDSALTQIGRKYEVFSYGYRRLELEIWKNCSLEQQILKSAKVFPIIVKEFGKLMRQKRRELIIE